MNTRPKTARDHLRRRARTTYKHPQLADTLASNGLPSIATGELRTYDGVLKTLLNRRTKRGA